AFVVPVSSSDVLARMQEIAIEDDVEPSFPTVGLESARARLEQALAETDELPEPVETETWPGCRALLEMLVRGMPSGGRGYDTAERDEDALTDAAHDFLDSPEG